MLNGMHKVMVGVAASLLLAVPAYAEWQPAGPISLWVGFGAGGSTDALSRAVANAIEEDTGWDIVVENVTGGAGVAMLTRLKAAEPNGLSLGVGVTTPVALQLVMRGDQLPFTVEDFDWLTTLGRAALVLAVKKGNPAQSFEALLEVAKTRSVTVGTNGPDQEMILRAISAETGGDFVPVPMKSEGEKIQNVLGGHVDASTPGGSHQEYVTAGELTVVAGLTPIRDPAAPDVPTVEEMGIPYAIDARFFVAAPTGMDPEARDAIVAAFQTALARPVMQEALKNMAVVPGSIGADEANAMMQDALVGIRALADAAK